MLLIECFYWIKHWSKFLQTTFEVSQTHPAFTYMFEVKSSYRSAVFIVNLLHTYFTLCSKVSTVNFEQVNASWEGLYHILEASQINIKNRDFDNT